MNANPTVRRAPARREALRLVIAILAITALYLVIESAEREVVRSLALRGWLDGDPQRLLVDEARDVAARSAAAEARLAPAHRAAAWRLGLELGFVSHWLGGYGKQPEDLMRQLSAPVAGRLANAAALADQLGIGPVAPLPVHTAQDFTRLNQRLAADEWGLAARVEAVTSSRCRHLFQLGLQVGATAAALEGTGTDLPIPPSDLIGRHATLAGLPRELWQPLARFESTGDKAAARLAYGASVAALDRAVVAMAARP